jgi:hypothetical protein
MFESVIVAIVVIAAGFYVVRSFLKMGKGESSCSGCNSGCQMKGKCAKSDTTAP